MNNRTVPSLEQYVARCTTKDEAALRRAGCEWVKVSMANRLCYEIEWMGVPVIQTPEDMVLMQELVFRLRPDFIIETGVAHGGSLVYYSSLLELLGKGGVIGVDIEIRDHNRAVIEGHWLSKRISLIEGDSTSQKTVDAVAAMIPAGSTAIVCLDSNHYREHVLRELMLYRRFVNGGSYMVVFDTAASGLVDSGVCDDSFRDNGPLEAIGDFLAVDNDFVIDEDFNRLYVSTSNNGYLRRVNYGRQDSASDVV
jgi:cephalosporin hydroxylase